MIQQQKSKCERCGTCCSKGGPALHLVDKQLLDHNLLMPEHLVTIRKGEPVFSLSGETPETAEAEIIKIKGKPGTWLCIFFEEHEAKCSIYPYRPLECTLLKCWDTLALEEVAGQDLLSRFDIIAPDNPAISFIRNHEKQFSLARLAQLLSAAEKPHTKLQALADLNELINRELALRKNVCRQLECSVDLELFYFGRPLFLILEQYGFKIHENNGIIHVSDNSLKCKSN